MKRLILLGPPGCGKGTQAERVIAKYGIPQISTGDIFRQNIADGTELGRKAKSYMDGGELVPDCLVVDLVADRLSQDDVKNGYLLDGFPRTIAQAEALDEVLAASGDSIDKVVYINTPKDELIRRISGRRLCPVCGRSYNVNNREFAPKVEGMCDACNVPIIQRDDDTEKTARNRIDVYNEQTLPLVDYYRKKGLLVEFDGTAPVEETFAGIEKILNA